MKYLLVIVLVSGLFMPLLAYAESLSYDEAYGNYLYQFHLSVSGTTLTSNEIYDILTGDVPAIPRGDWSVMVTNSRGEKLYSQFFDAAKLAAQGGDFTIPYQNSGTEAIFKNSTGVTALSIDLTGSRVCDDNGVCYADAGENSYNCPGDCGAIAAQPALQVATVGAQIPLSSRIGEVVMKLAFGVAGILIITGVAQSLDRRRRA